jgi:hypothetical protein
MHSVNKIYCHISLKMNSIRYNSLLHKIKYFTLYVFAYLLTHDSLIHWEDCNFFIKTYTVSCTALMFRSQSIEIKFSHA